ncbi:hypothetical protein [Flavobacterium sp.]|uniref:hypothetical protein n=1 Tax=Flavobacterium sp. TaxID=239 RepID=UPI00286A530A|nr:hypothetical protein [Flavobacterium sp.]
MKTLKIITLAIMMQFASYSVNAQVSVNVNLGTQPYWAPVGYSSANYYYIPDIQTYYDVRTTQFIYLNRGVWVRSSNLPRQYRNYDLNRGYKVVINNYKGSRPYYNYKNDKIKYYKGYKGSPQKSIGHRKENHKAYGNNKNNSAKHEKGNKGNGNN